MTTEKHTAKRIDDGEYEYRGHRIYRNDSVSNGYYGRWQVGSHSRGFATDSMASAKAFVDRKIAARGEQG